MIFGGFRGVVGFVGIQPLSCTKRKNARNASSFFRAAIFLFGQDARNRRAESTSKSVTYEYLRQNLSNFFHVFVGPETNLHLSCVNRLWSRDFLGRDVATQCGFTQA